MFNRLFAGVLFIAVVSLTVGCGPTYVQPVQQGYVQPQVVVQPVAVDPIYDAALTIAMFNGQRGYYDRYHSFHTVVVVNGYQGYYDNNHRFVSNAPEVRAAVQSHKPLYVTPPVSASTSGSNSAKPAYNQGTGTATRGPATAPVAASPGTTKPQYNTGSGTATRGPTTTATSTPVSTKPSYGSPVSAPAAKPSYGSSSPSRSSSSSSSKPSYGGKR